MEIFFADDSTQKSRRENMETVIGVGGVLVHEAAIRPLTRSMDEIAEKFGVPAGEEFKWSPHKSSWIYRRCATSACVIPCSRTSRTASARSSGV